MDLIENCCDSWATPETPWPRPETDAACEGTWAECVVPSTHGDGLPEAWPVKHCGRTTQTGGQARQSVAAAERGRDVSMGLTLGAGRVTGRGVCDVRLTG